MTSDMNRPDPILPPPLPPAGPAAQPNDATQPAFPAVTPAPSGAAPVPALPQPGGAQPPAWTQAPAPVAPQPGWGTATPAAPSAPAVDPAAAWTRPPAVPPAPTSPWASPAASVPPVVPPAAADWASLPPTPPHAPQARIHRGVTPMVLAAAIVATAVLTAGTTYVAVEATHPAPTAQANQLTAAQPSSGASGATAPSGQAPSLTPANPLPANGQASIPDIVKAVGPAVVTITAYGATSTDPVTGMSSTGQDVGSGVIFDANGLVLTNHHVVAGNPSKLTVTLKDGRTFNASIYGIDTLTDLAIVKIEGASGLPTAPIGTSANIQVGQQTIAIGSPLGDLTNSVTSGIVSALGRQIAVEGETLDNLIQTDTPINPGNSGGPLLDAGGNVIGINTAISSNAQNIGFAIPIDIARPLLAQASAGQPLARAWLGVRFQTIDPTLQQSLNLPVSSGALIPTAAQEQAQLQAGSGSSGTNPYGNGTNPFGNGTNPYANGNGGSANGNGGATGSSASIVAGGPAQKAGLAAGDIITAVNGTKLDATHTLDLLLGQLNPGQQTTLSILRNGQTISVTVTLGTRPQSV